MQARELTASVEIPCTEKKNLFVQSPSGSKLPKNRDLRGVKTESVQRLTHKEESVSRRKSGESSPLKWDFFTPMASVGLRQWFGLLWPCLLPEGRVAPPSLTRTLCFKEKWIRSSVSYLEIICSLIVEYFI